MEDLRYSEGSTMSNWTQLALTEDTPIVKPYDQAAWARLDDSRTTPIETSLTPLEALHDRWVRLVRSMTPSDFERRINHPETTR